MFTEEMVVITHNVLNQMDHDTNKLPVPLCLQNVSKLTLSGSELEMKLYTTRLVLGYQQHPSTSVVYKVNL
jgi:hypothetical protein